MITRYTKLQKMLKKVEGAKSLEELEEIRIEIFGKKGFLAAEFARMKSLDGDEKKALAKELNDIKESIGDALETKKEALALDALAKQLEKHFAEKEKTKMKIHFMLF